MTLASISADDLRGLEGRVFDKRFRLTKLIDVGGFGAVYEATDDKIPNRRVAVKLGMAVASERAFTREAQLVGQVNHDNIVKVFDYGVENGLPFIVMDMLHGDRLDALIKPHGGRLPRDLLIKFVNEVGSALSHAHRKHLVHRDLKPKNVILVDTGTVDDHGDPVKRFVILDFGIAGKIDATDSLANQTMAGAGTPEYMSPEQIAGEESTAATDTYSFGVLLYQLLTGRVPFPLSGSSPGAIAQVITSIVNERPPSFALTVPALTFPPDVEEVVMECLEKVPQDRPASIRDVRRRFITAYAASLESDTDAGAATLTPDQLAEGINTTSGVSHTWKDTTRIPAATTMIPMLAVLSVILVATGAVLARWYFGGEGPVAALQLKGKESLEVVAGNAEPLTLILTRPRGVDTVQLRVEDPPSGVTVEFPQEVSAGQDIIDCQVVTDLNASPFEGDLLFVATAGDKTSELHQPLKLTAPPVWTPQTANFPVKASGELVGIGGRVFSRVLEYRVDSERVRFRLIDPRSSREPVAPFYIMENKVWDGLYQIFERETPNSGNRKAVLDDNRFPAPDLPAFGMTANEAHQFTQWLGGAEANLPTIHQWWAAAGFFEKTLEPPFAVGPFRLQENNSNRLNEVLNAPRPVGQSPIDVSIQGIYDMGFNGSEWTSTLCASNRTANFPVTTELESIYLVGRAFGYERLIFEEATPYFDPTFTGDSIYESSEPTRPHHDCGFRVVINPSR